jgi:hypothetical protein
MNAPASKLDGITLQTETADLRWEVLSHLELPGGSIAWLHVSPIANDLTTALLSSKALLIEETGVVAKLKVTNPLMVDILLPTDLIVDGGKQARVVERSVIVAAQTSVEVGVRCVEQGRWAVKDATAASAKNFAVNAPANVGSRSHLAKLKKQSYSINKDYALDQSAVWTHVQNELHRTKVSSNTQSYVAFMDQSDNAARLKEAKRLDIEPPDHANAIALVQHGGPNGGGVWLEIFPSRAAMLPIVANVVADALDPPQQGAPSRPTDPRIRTNEAMRRVAQSPLAAISKIEMTLGDAYGFEAEAVAGQALLFKRRLAHVVASVNA